jgi:hypothetical protein
MRCLIKSLLLTLALACSARAALDTNKVWAFYCIDSFSAGDDWQGPLRAGGFPPSRQINLATNGQSMGCWYTNAWPYMKTLLPPLNSGTQAVIFLMGGVNPSREFGPYAAPPDLTAAQFKTVHSNVVWEAHQSNAIVVAYSITGTENDALTSGADGTYAQWKTNINASVLAGAADYKIDTAGTWPYSVENYPDGIHPSAAIYTWIGTNTAAKLLATATSARTARANRGNAGTIRKP